MPRPVSGQIFFKTLFTRIKEGLYNNYMAVIELLYSAD